MHCPHCGFTGATEHERCPRCGQQQTKPSLNTMLVASPPHALLSLGAEITRGSSLGNGRYRVKDTLPLPENQQAQGKAWLALDNESHKPVVIREVVIPKQAVNNAQQFVRAIALRMAELGRYPGFPDVLDFFNEKGTYFLVLEYIEGESLALLLKRQGGALPEQVVADYGRQLCEKLQFLARQHPPLVHGSISPETIIVSPDKKHVSLINFPLYTTPSSSINRDKAPSGYLAPEQMRGITEPASDLYAVAATLHHAVTGYHPRERLAFFHPPARRLNPAVSAGMEAILLRGLSLSALQRYARPLDMQADLMNLLNSYSSSSEEAASPVMDKMKMSSSQIRAWSKRRSLQNIGVATLVSLLLIVTLLITFVSPMIANNIGANGGLQDNVATRTAQAALDQETALEMQNFQEKGIGLSDGRFVFDTYAGRADADLKKNAAQAIQRGDMSGAVNFLTRAVTADPADGEVQIYNENMHIKQSGIPYVTLVLGLAIDDTPNLFINRADMESAFLIQHEINTNNSLPHYKLNIMIDNSGPNNEDVGTAAQFISNRVLKAGNPDHIIGVIGWPFSTPTINARDIIAAAHLPLISQTASSVKLSGSSPYFFRVNPPDDLQGNTLGTVAVNQLHAKTILVLRDPTDAYSVSLADAFSKRVTALNAQAINNPNDYFTEDSTTTESYQKVVQDAVTNNADIIFLPGLDADAVRLTHALATAARANPTNAALAKLRILAGDGVDTSLLLGQGHGQDAEIAHEFPQDFQRLSFSAFGHPDEWNFLHIPPNLQPKFFSAWTNLYQSSTVQENNAPPPGNDAILTYDAVKICIYAATLADDHLTGQTVRDALAAIGNGNAPAYQGVSGRIFFNAQGNPVDKALVLLNIQQVDGHNTIVLNQIAGVFR